MAKFQKKNSDASRPSTTASSQAVLAPKPEENNTPAVERERIAERAYELYVSRGGQGGRELDDWLEAERELTASSRGDRG
jgi:DUF2934 family protein